MNDSNTLKQTFDEVAVLYNESRPRYPAELFSALVDITNVQSNDRLLEIGAGTGQATKPLAALGFQITAVELGSSLAEVAEHELSGYNNVQIINESFERVELPPKSFDLVYAATAFHWIDEQVKFAKTHALLKDNGHLAIIHTNHVSDEKGDRFFFESLPIYERHKFVDTEKPQLPQKDQLRPDEFDKRLFRLMEFQQFPIVINYTATGFVKLLNTYSNHLAAPKETQRLFYRDIERLINDQFDGVVEKHFSMSLTVAQKIV
jgi:SAM-dependent methyltransferase